MCVSFDFGLQLFSKYIFTTFVTKKYFFSSQPLLYNTKTELLLNPNKYIEFVSNIQVLLVVIEALKCV